jgi:hypothetical protein
MRTRYPITTQKFNGARFEDHGLDLDVLHELIAYKVLLIETAKSLWRAKNPNRQRLKKNFEESVRLKFYELEPGSVAVPIEREYEVADSAEGLSFVQLSPESSMASEVTPTFDWFRKRVSSFNPLSLSIETIWTRDGA